jgi:hypothetical protein
MIPAFLEKVLSQKYQFIPTEELPRNIREGNWPKEFFSDQAKQTIGVVEEEFMVSRKIVWLSSLDEKILGL